MKEFDFIKKVNEFNAKVEAETKVLKDKVDSINNDIIGLAEKINKTVDVEEVSKLVKERNSLIETSSIFNEKLNAVVKSIGNIDNEVQEELKAYRDEKQIEINKKIDKIKATKESLVAMLEEVNKDAKELNSNMHDGREYLTKKFRRSMYPYLLDISNIEKIKFYELDDKAKEVKNNSTSYTEY